MKELILIIFLMLIVLSLGIVYRELTKEDKTIR